jgi:hypothetical protein
MPKLDELFIYHGSGVMSGRVWIVAPDARSLADRWRTLQQAPAHEKEALFFPHLERGGALGDRHMEKIVSKPLAGFPARSIPLSRESGSLEDAILFGFRSFDRQWIIPDARVINRPNPQLWESRSDAQLFLTAPWDKSPTAGPALSFTALVPDAHHYSGRGGRVFPLWADRTAADPNIKPALLSFLSQRLNRPVSSEDVMAYIAGIAAHPAYTARFHDDLSTPGLRIPITADPELFERAAELGRTVIWLHTFGDRMRDEDQGRPAHLPRLQHDRRPTIPKEGAISEEPEEMPDTIEYDAGKRRLLVGHGFIENVTPAMWAYEVSGKQVLVQWFSYRKRDRERPIIGDRRQPSPLGDIQPNHWLAEYTTELLNVLNVLGRLIGLEPNQAELLDEICSSSLISVQELNDGGALEPPPPPPAKPKQPRKARKPSDGIRPKVKHDNLFEKPELGTEDTPGAT